MAELIYSQESYILNKIFFTIQNDLGTKFQEKHYDRAIEAHFINNKIPYQKQVLVKVYYQNKLLGEFYIDFIVWNKIIIELKTTPFNKSEYIKQLRRYLEAKNMRLGLVVNFGIRPLKPIRVLNPSAPIINSQN